jgi:4-hydroxythreonine-4-phosphate dehydrogenase
LGIGPQILVKALKKIKTKTAAFIVAGERTSLLKAGWQDNMGELVEVTSRRKKPAKPQPSKWGGEISYKALIEAIEIVKAGKAHALVTAPISKEAWQMAGVKFTGHTEVLKKYAAGEGALMMFKSGKINCALATEHLAIKDVSKGLSKQKIIQSVKIFAKQLGKNAAIAISALNPHAGDGGKLGKEEAAVISPAIKTLRRLGYNVSGPWPIDSLWSKHANGQYAGIVCMYHDAALTGLKLAAKEPVIHITAGLKFLRVSPTHGTAFDIAAKNTANPQSMLAAIKYAIS